MKIAWGRTHLVGLMTGVAAFTAFGAHIGALAGDDKSTASAVMELVGVSSDPDISKIDYSERPKLVLPPSKGVLPEPKSGANRPNGWPSDMAGERRRNSDRFMRIGNAPVEKKPGVLESALSFGQSKQAPVVDEPGRNMLTEPPTGYRRPTQDLGKIQDPDKKSSWWNPLSWGGSRPAVSAASQTAATRPEEEGAIASLRKLTGMDSSSSAPAAAPRGQQAANGGSDTWLQMPRFVRGSDSN